ncbi:hypothetical protein BDN72DRAFT_375715 [Pluteus cervinus]|uniref:Uncharacterized protein n=1 Tax=Pluteus cervinus TaxID=181527 RepID=A0ACD3AB14_9AGAR|nr:hypothetical protein BDN72DRAFT_375715 [Pluteus cervinus]
MSGAGRRESGGFGGGGAGGGPSNSTAVPTSKPKKFPKFNRIKPNADSQTTTPIVKAEPMSVEIPSLSGPSPFSQRQRPSISGFTQPQPAPIPPLLAKARVMAQSDPRERQPVVPDPRRIGWARERAVPIPLPLPPPVPRPTVPLGRGQRLPLPHPPPVIPDQRPPPLPPHVRAPPSVEWRSSGQETRGNSGWGGDWADLNSTWNDAPPPPPSTAPAAFGSKESGGSWYDDDSGWGVPHPAGWSTAQTRQRRDSWHTTDPRETRDTRDTREIGRATSRDSDRRWVGHESEWDNRGWNNPSNRRNSDHGYRRPSDDRGRGSISNPSGGGGGGARGWDNHRRDEWDGSNRATYDRDEWDRERERERESEWSVQPARPHWNVYRPSEGGGRGDYSRRDQDRDRDRDYQRPRVPERDRDYQRSRDPSRERDRERDREGGWGSYTAPTWEPPKANEVVKPKDVPDRIIKEEVVEETIYGLGLWSKDQNTQASGVWSANGVYDAPPAAAAQTRDSDAVEPEPDHDSGSDMEIDSPTEENGFQSNKATSSPVRAKNKDGQVTGQESEKLGKRKRTQSDAKEAGPLSIRTDLSTTTAGPADQDDSPPRGGIVPPRFKKWGGRNKIDDTPISPIDTSTTTTQDIDSEKPTTAVAAAGAQPSITTAGSEKAPKAKTKSALAKQTKSSAAAASAAAATVPILVDDGLPFPAEHPSEIASNSISRRTRSKTSTTTKRGGAVAASAAHSATTPKEKVKPKEKAKPKGKEKVDEGTATTTKVKVKAKAKTKDLEKDKVVEKAVEKAADGEKEKEKPVAKVVEKEKEKEKPAVAKKTKVPKQVDKVDKPDKTDKVEEPKEKQPKAKEKEKEKEKKVAVVKKRKRAQSSISGPLPDTTVAVPSQEPSAASKKVEAPPASTSASAPPPPKDVVVPTMGPPATAEAPRKPLLIKIKRSPQKKKSGSYCL